MYEPRGQVYGRRQQHQPTVARRTSGRKAGRGGRGEAFRQGRVRVATGSGKRMGGLPASLSEPRNRLGCHLAKTGLPVPLSLTVSGQRRRPSSTEQLRRAKRDTLRATSRVRGAKGDELRVTTVKTSNE